MAFLGNKSFTLTKKGAHRRKSFYDISGFFADGERTLPLDEAAKLFLDEGKLPDVDRRKLGSDPAYYPAHRANVIQYCKRDADLAVRLGRLLIKTLEASLGFYPSRFNSKASISKAWAEVTQPELFKKKPPRRWDLFRSSYKGGIFHTRVLGRVANVSEVDITSAYGAALLKAPNVTKLSPIVSKSYHKEALLGSYWILIDYDGRLPLTAKARGKKQARTVYPTSNGQLRPYTASKAEMDYFVESGRSFVVLMAEEYFGEYRPQFPELQTLLDKVAELKESAKTDPKAKVERMLHKTIVNALYGCLAESKHGETPLTNWPLAAEITGRCRAAIWREWDHQKSHGSVIVSINTDSIRFAIDPEADFIPCESCAIRKGIGEFDNKFTGATVTHYQSGIALIEHSNGTTELRKRGKPLLTPEMLRSATGPTVSVPSRHVTHLFEALAQNRAEEIGAFDDPEDSGDDTKIDLASNRWALDFDPADLRFEVLNVRPVIGTAPDYDDITSGKYEARARLAGVRTTRRTSAGPESPPRQPLPAPLQSEPSEIVRLPSIEPTSA
ncbi:MAG TPA: hypothetical protein VGV64_05700 [Thermoplasmata archaeon]|nr:hypothetical protein [Thermoplasmata archaeon]